MSQDFQPEPPPVQNFRPAPPPVRQKEWAINPAYLIIGSTGIVLIIAGGYALTSRISRSDVRPAKVASQPKDEISLPQENPAESSRPLPADLHAIFQRAELDREAFIELRASQLNGARRHFLDTKRGIYAFSPSGGWIDLGVSPETVNWKQVKKNHPDSFDKEASIAQADKEVERQLRYWRDAATKKYWLIPVIKSLADGETGTIENGKVVQVVDDSQAIVNFRGRDVWVEGINFSKTADGDRLSLTSSIMVVSGTSRFTTVLGANRTLVRLSRHPDSDEVFRLARIPRSDWVDVPPPEPEFSDSLYTNGKSQKWAWVRDGKPKAAFIEPEKVSPELTAENPPMEKSEDGIAIEKQTAAEKKAAIEEAERVRTFQAELPKIEARALSKAKTAKEKAEREAKKEADLFAKQTAIAERRANMKKYGTPTKPPTVAEKAKAVIDKRKEKAVKP